MAIYLYDGTQKNPPNYIGVRVAVSVNKKVRQRWFKNATEIPSAAKELEQQWKLEQQLYKAQRNRDRTERIQHSAYVTGVKGIKMKFVINQNVTKGKTLRYYTPSFVVSGSVNNRRFHKAFNIKRFGFYMAWFHACSYAAKQYGESLLNDMLKKRPAVEQFHIIYNWQTKQGHNIPFHRMPDELLSQELN